MPAFSLAAEADTTRRNVTQAQQPTNPNDAIKKFIKDLDVYEKRYQEEFDYLDAEANTILDKLEETTAEDDENLEVVERNLEAIRVHRRKLSKLYAEASHREERPWIIGVSADEETSSWGGEWIFSDVESLLSRPLDLESGEQVGVEAAREFNQSMEGVEAPKTGSGVRKGRASRLVSGEGVGMAKMFDTDQINLRNATRQKVRGVKVSETHDGESHEWSDSSSSSIPSADSFAERLAEQNKADMEKRRGCPNDNIEVLRHKTPEIVMEGVEAEEVAPEPVSGRKEVKAPARRTKTRSKRPTVEERVRETLLNPKEETDSLVRGLFPIPGPSIEKAKQVKQKSKKSRPVAAVQDVHPVLPTPQPPAKKGADLEDIPLQTNNKIPTDWNTPSLWGRDPAAMNKISSPEMLLNQDQDFTGEASPRAGNPPSSSPPTVETESSDGLFVSMRTPWQPSGTRGAPSPSPPPRETPARSQFMQDVVSSNGLSYVPESSAASRRSRAPQPESRLRTESVDFHPFFGALPKEILRLPEQDMEDEKVKKRGADRVVDGALGLFVGAEPPMKKMKMKKKGGSEMSGGSEGEGKSLGRVKWPGQAEVVMKKTKKGGKRGLGSPRTSALSRG